MIFKNINLVVAEVAAVLALEAESEMVVLVARGCSGVAKAAVVVTMRTAKAI